MDVTLLDYALPEELVAQRPLDARDGARLLVLDRGSVGRPDPEAAEERTRSGERGADRDAAELPYGLVPRLEERRSAVQVAHRAVRDLAELMPPTLWVVNDTRVLAARLFARRASGGRVEIFLLERSGEAERWRALGRASKPLREGDVLAVEGTPARLVIASGPRPADGTIEVDCDGGIEAVLEAAGHVPLPPYIRRPDEPEDRARYQTVFAAHPGAVAAPTAGLHFTDALIGELEQRGHRFARVTLHVGAGTFRPVKSARLEDHPMHTERYVISSEAELAIDRARRDGLPLVAVGTTVVRTLESAAIGEGRVKAGAGSTALFIRPGFEFRVIDGLLTNFHQPRSTLLALVMAFAGADAIRDAYAEAVAARYRFFSYGDAMLIRPRARAAESQVQP